MLFKAISKNGCFLFVNGHLGYSQGKKTRENQYYLSESIRNITDKIPPSYFTSTDVSVIKAGSILFSSNGLKIEKATSARLKDSIVSIQTVAKQASFVSRNRTLIRNTTAQKELE